MITIKNSQRTIEVDTQKLEQSAQTILKELGYEGYDLGIWLTTNKTIHSYNKTYRKKTNQPTFCRSRIINWNRAKKLNRLMMKTKMWVI